MTKIPVNVNYKVKVGGQVELVLQYLAEVFLVNIVEPMTYANIELVGGFIKEDTAARNHGIVVFSVEDGRRITLGLGTVVLFLPIGLVQFADSGFPINKYSLLGVYLLYTEKSAVGHIIPKDSHFRFAVVHKASHGLHQLVVFAVGSMIDIVVVFGHKMYFSECKDTQNVQYGEKRFGCMGKSSYLCT